MAYTLSGRLQSRLAAVLGAAACCCVLSAALSAWWPLELAGLMLGVGLFLDLAYDRRLDYQPGWVAVPLGLLELALVMALALTLSSSAPRSRRRWPSSGFVGARPGARPRRLPAHSAVVRRRRRRTRSARRRVGGRPRRIFGTAGGYAWSTRRRSSTSRRHPPGPDRDHARQHLVGERGAVVRGGIIVRASHVLVRDVTTLGGEYGIEVDGARDVVLDDVRVVGATLDGIHVRRSRVTIRDCRIDSPSGYTQGIDISFSADMGMSMVEGCTVVGGQQGIVVDSAGADIHGNRVSTTSYQAITMTEMSMGMIAQNQVAGAVGAGIACVDQSMCMIEDNHVYGTRPDSSTPDLERQAGYAIVSDYKAEAELADNELVGNAGRVGVFAGAVITELD